MAKPQLEMVVNDPARAKAEEDDAIENERLLRAELWVALRAAVRELGGSDAVATELDKRWGGRPDEPPIGRSVSGSTLRACLGDSERNYFRAEWLLWFASKSERVADLLLEIAGGKRGAKPIEDEHADLQAELRREFPRQAEAMIRKSKAPRRR